jgi:hypothetical protein
MTVIDRVEAKASVTQIQYGSLDVGVLREIKPFKVGLDPIWKRIAEALAA